ncbi:MAG TPA: acetaldehyde dehydrogenase (acetylating) [Chloroflexota bacterium]|nr:acetaldehyde dehydrogenase (acetylating) [Chloroflexota bacterium]
MPKVKVAIIGSGNIGTDLMYKLQRSPWLELVYMVGIDPQSEGLARARAVGIATTDQGIEAFLADPKGAEIVFDATSAAAHRRHAPLLEQAGMVTIDLTPAKIGEFVVPPVNLGEHLEAKNVNLVSCGGQATIPIVAAINRVQPVEYAEIVATIASKSAGPGTRQNIDEFTETTGKGLVAMGGAQKGKAIIILNPAEPPILMRNTIYAMVEHPDEAAITRSIEEMVRTVQSYVPGYRLRTEPLFDGNKVTVFVEVTGAGDYLPTYAGNLDIMTAAAVKVGEEFAKHLLAKRGEPVPAGA